MLFLGLLLQFAAQPRIAQAWGTAAHESVQEAAVQLLVDQGHPLAVPLTRNLETVRRVGAVPGVEWQPGTHPEGMKKVRGSRKPSKVAEYHEQGLHQFQVDAFLTMGTADNAVLSLPMGPYRDVYAKYQRLLRENFVYVSDFVTRKTTPESFGTAPWRALQLYDLGVKALREGRMADAIYTLGLAAHYIADLAEPLNSTINFEGRRYPISAAGVYPAFETDIFVERPSPAGSVIAEARASLNDRGVDGLTRPRILEELFRLVNSGTALVDPILKAFSDQCSRAHGRALASLQDAGGGAAGAGASTGPYCEPEADPQTHRALLAGFMNATVAPDADAPTIRELAERRLGDAAVLVARIWAAAYNEAGRPALAADLSVPFESLKASANYIEPDYLPARGPAKQ